MIHPCLRFATLNIIIQLVVFFVGWSQCCCFAFDVLSEGILIWFAILFSFSLSLFVICASIYSPNQLTLITIITLNKVNDRSIESSTHIYIKMHMHFLRVCIFILYIWYKELNCKWIWQEIFPKVHRKWESEVESKKEKEYEKNYIKSTTRH